jgi:hypothetical protein
MKHTRFILPLLAVLFVTLIQGQASAADSPVGSWKWFNNDSIVVKPDSTVWRDDQKLGDWEWTDKAKLEFTIVWQAVRKDKLTLSADGNKISGVNADGEPVSGTRVPLK